MKATGLTFSPHLPPPRAPGITTRLSLPADQRIRTYCQVNNLSPSEVLRELIRIGWGVTFGTQLDAPMGCELPVPGVEPAEEKQPAGVN